MGMPMIVGAGVGALGSAAMGKNPLQGAALGGALGGFGQAAGMFGAGATGAGTSGASGIIGSTGEIGSSLLSANPALSGASSVTGSAAIQNAAKNIGMGLNYTPPTIMQNLGTSISDAASNAFDYAKANPMNTLSATNQIAEALTPQQQAQQTMQPSIPPISRGSYNVAPTLGQGQNNKVASQMQITPNQLQVYPNFYFRGGY